VASCVTNYERLIVNVHSVMNPGKIIVLAVMPVRESVVDRASHELNENIRRFNHELESVCKRHEAKFVDLSAAVGDGHGGLSGELTTDGLHLNAPGYQKVAAVLGVVLAEKD
jgi:lysophospholipase L1-like esterase